MLCIVPAVKLLVADSALPPYIGVGYLARAKTSKVSVQIVPILTNTATCVVGLLLAVLFVEPLPHRWYVGEVILLPNCLSKSVKATF